MSARLIEDSFFTMKNICIFFYFYLNINEEIDNEKYGQNYSITNNYTKGTTISISLITTESLNFENLILYDKNSPQTNSSKYISSLNKLII